MDLKSIPKVALHRHLELSVRHSTIKELAPQFGFDVSTQEKFAEKFLLTEPMADLGSALSKFLDTQKLLASEEILERLAFEACEDAVNEGIKVLELRYAPTFVRLGHEDKLTYDQIHKAFVRGVEKAEGQFNIAVGLICIVQRILPLETAEEIIDFAIANKDTFVGVDLADNEVGFDCKPFAPYFKKAKEAGLGITIHSGEANVPEAPQYILDAVKELGATRIGHGVQIYRDQAVIDFAKENNITLELCPTSNWLTNATGETKDHPFRKIMEAGVRTTINTDDPGIFNIDMIHEYKVLQDQHDFTLEEFNKCNQFAYEASFIPEEKKAKAWKS